jgi:hypothetical protein
MFEIIFTDVYERAIERTSVYRPSAVTKRGMVLEALERVESDTLVYGFQVADGGKP